MQPVSIIASGMVTAVGLDAPSSCAAFRCGVDNFAETRFIDTGGEWIIGAQAPLDQPWRGYLRLRAMLLSAIRECLSQAPAVVRESIPLLLCLSERDRPGRPDGLEENLLQSVRSELGIGLHPKSGMVPRGRVAGALALGAARELLYGQNVPACLVAGVDSFLHAPTIAAYQSENRLLTSQNSNGFIPGEAAAAVLVTRPAALRPASAGEEVRELLCLGIGTGHESATVRSDEPLRGEGLVQAFKAAFAEAGCAVGDLDYRITDSNGEQYWFKEATLALDKVLRRRIDLFDIWHPADCIGEVGAAVGPCCFAVALDATRKHYAFGRGPLCHFSADTEERLAVVLAARGGTSNSSSHG